MNPIRTTAACLCLASLVACQPVDTSNWSASPLDGPGARKAPAAATEPGVLPPLQAMPNTTPLPPESAAAEPAVKQAPVKESALPASKEIKASKESKELSAKPQPKVTEKVQEKVQPKTGDGKMRMPNMLDLPADSEFRPKPQKQNDSGVIVRPPDEKR